MGETIDIFRLSGMKYPILILPSTFSTVSDESLHKEGEPKLSNCERNLAFMGIRGIARIQLRIGRSSFSFDISSHPATIDQIDKGQTIREGGAERHGSW